MCAMKSTRGDRRSDHGLGIESFEALDAALFESCSRWNRKSSCLAPARVRFPDPALSRRLAASGIGLEVMDTRAACRTYNILIAEGRKVVAAILIA